MSFESILRAQTDLFALTVLAVVGASIILRSRDQRFIDARLFLHIIISLMAILMLDGTGWLLDGRPGPLNRVLLYIVNTLYFALHFLPMALYMVYVDHFTAPTRPLKSSGYFRLAIAASVLGAVFALASLAGGALFTIGEDNVYARGPWMGAFSLANAFLGLLPLYILMRRRKSISSPSFYNLILYPIMPIIGGSLQYFMYGSNFLWPTTAISVLLTFINVQNRQIDSDYLTGAFNRSSLEEFLNSLMRKVNARRTFSGIMLDLDFFKKINDNHGHLAGDQALIETAQILRNSVRRTDFVARYGGDEFIIILETGSRTVLNDVAARILANMKAANSPEKPYTLSASLGKAIFDLERDGNLDIFLHRLDRLMYEDKARLVDIA